MQKIEKQKIMIVWPEITNYAARCIREFIKMYGHRYDVQVVATRPNVPIRGMAEILNNKLVWWEDIPRQKTKIIPNAFDFVDIAFFGGYKTEWIKEIRLNLKKKNPRLKSILMSDNCQLSVSIKSIIYPYYFKLFHKKKFDGILVPGIEGEELAKKIGFKSMEIRKGLYSADSDVFHFDVTSLQKEKIILFVGQFIERKNIKYLIDEFKKSGIYKNGWSLRIIGSGSSEYNSEPIFNISVSGFLQPVDLANEYRKAKVFALLSTVENWGLVVHEASLSGCYLLLSENIGSRRDFLNGLNGMTHNLNGKDLLRNKLRLLDFMNEEKFNSASFASQEQALKFSKSIFSESLKYFVCQLDDESGI